MTSNPILSDEVAHTNKDEVSTDAAIFDNAARIEKGIKYEKMLKLVSREHPDANSNLLENPIHTIFQKQNWQNPGQDVWPQLQPALRLASRFIGEEAMLGFWYHLIWGRQEMQDVSKEFGYSLERFSAEGPPLDMTQKQQTSLWLREYGDSQESTFLSFKAGVRLGNTTQTAAKNILVELQWELFELLRDHGSGQKILSETRLLTVSFLIAVTLTHELGHAVHLSVSRSKYEPYYGDHVLAELGHAWACWAFGGAITTIRRPTGTEIDRICGLWVATPPSPWQEAPLPKAWPASRPPPPVLGELPKNAICWVLASEYIQRVQTDGFWEKDVRSYGVRALRVPPTDGLHEFQPPLNSNWIASVSMSRGPNHEMNIEDCSFRDGAEWNMQE